MEDTRPEEKSPLLLYLLEEEGDLAKTHKRVNFDKGRLYGISSGATTVFTEFPNYISPCWVTALLSSLIFLVMVLLMASAMSPGSIRVPKCNPSDGLEKLGNSTIHLVHSSEQWSQNELETLEKIKRDYPGYNIHLVLMHGDDTGVTASSILTTLPLSTTSKPKNDSNLKKPINSSLNEALIEITRARRNKRNIKSMTKRKRKDLAVPIGIGFGVKNLLDMLLGNKVDNMFKRNASNDLPDLLNLTELFPLTTQTRPKTLKDVTQDFPGLTIENVTAKEAFHKSPLEETWTKLNPDLVLFALRVLHLWQYGGLSFKIDENISPHPYMHKWKKMDSFSLKPDTIRIKPSNFFDDSTANKLLKFIQNGKVSFERLPKEVVTADDEGLHIFTKSPCHVFFGEVLVNLRRARGDETPKRIIRKSLKVFCKHSAVGNNYCRNLIRTAA